MVDCTSDHSLVNSDGHAMFPSGIVCGETALMQSFPTDWIGKVQTVDMTCTRRFEYKGNVFDSYKACIQTLGLSHPLRGGSWVWNKKECTVTPDLARLMGFFMGDGSCGTWESKTTWQLNNSNYTMLLYYQSILEKVFQEFEWSIMDTMKSSSVYKLAPSKSQYGSVVHLAGKWRKLLYREKDKIVPSVILNSPEDVRKAFLRGLHDADGTKNTKLPEISQKSQISAQSICTLMKSLGYVVVVDGRSDKPNVFRLRCRLRTRKAHNVVKRVMELPHEEFVYDLTTENHHFHAGIGNMIVHNTDSVMCCFPGVPATMEGMRKCVELGTEAAGRITHEVFRDDPEKDLEFEEVKWPFIIFETKKRYLARIWEHADQEKGKLYYKGVEKTRRDNALFLRNVYEEVMKSAVPLTGPPLSKREFAVRARTVIRGALDRLVADDVPLEEFYISKSIKRDYKDTLPAQKVLANKINARIDSGEMVREPIVSGDRLSYVVIRNSSSKKLMDKVEDPEWFRQHPKLELDKAYYVKNQIVRPMNQLLSAFGTHIDDLAEMALAEIECKRLRVKPLRKIATKVTPPPPKLVEKKRKVEVVHNTISRYYRGKDGAEIAPPKKTKKKKARKKEVQHKFGDISSMWKSK